MGVNYGWFICEQTELGFYFVCLNDGVQGLAAPSLSLRPSLMAFHSMLNIIWIKS